MLSWSRLLVRKEYKAAPTKAAREEGWYAQMSGLFVEPVEKTQKLVSL